MLGNAILNLIGVTDEIGVIEAEHAEEIVHTANVAVGDLGLYRVTELCAEELGEPGWDREVPLDGGWPEGGFGLDVGAIEWRCELNRGSGESGCTGSRAWPGWRGGSSLQSAAED